MDVRCNGQIVSKYKKAIHFSLFFSFHDKNGDSVSAEVDVDVRIVNEIGKEVYRKTKTVSKDDFGYYHDSIKDSELWQIFELRYIGEMKLREIAEWTNQERSRRPKDVDTVL